MRAIVDDAGNDLFVSVINLGEVYYTLQRTQGPQVAEAILSVIFLQPNRMIVDTPWPRVRAAADLKARGRLSYADAFAAALAAELRAPLVTGDPEFALLEQTGLIQVLWLPRR